MYFRGDQSDENRENSPSFKPSLLVSFFKKIFFHKIAEGSPGIARGKKIQIKKVKLN